MKLSKKGAAIQRAIHDALASGKALGGLLVGFAATVAGCRESHSPAHTMGRFPDPRYQQNAANENAKVLVTEGEISEPEQESPKTNNVNEVKDVPVLGDEIPPGAQLTLRTAGVIMSRSWPTNTPKKTHLDKGNVQKLKDGSGRVDDVKVEVDL